MGMILDIPECINIKISFINPILEKNLLISAGSFCVCLVICIKQETQLIAVQLIGLV